MSSPSTATAAKRLEESADAAPTVTLRAKLVRSLILLILLIGLLTVGALAKLQVDRFSADEQQLEQLISDSLKAKASQLVHAHAEALGILAADNALSDMQRLVERTIERDPDVVYGAFISPSGLALAFGSPEHSGAIANRAKVFDTLDIDPSVVKRGKNTIRKIHRFGHPIVEVASPVFEGEEVVGMLFYGVSAKRLRAEMERFRRSHTAELRWVLLQLLGIILLITMGAVFFASRVARNVTLPVVRLTEAAKQLSAGERGVRVEIRSGDELETLGATFNAMVSDLDASYAELQASNAKLHQQVEERRKAEAERAAAERDLFQAQKMDAIGQLAGGVAHDFNNLLSAVQGNAELLELMPCSAQARERTDAIKRAVAYGASLTRQLLTFSRKQEDEPRLIDPGLVVLNLQKLVGRLLEAQLDLQVVVGGDTPLVYMDPGRLEQVLMNLAVNARDAVSGRGKIRIATGKRVLESPINSATGAVPAGSYFELVVEDDGAGMSHEVSGHIFEPFFTTKEEGKGTGLGLATVHGIVGQANGFIDVETELGQGTVFRVLLPAMAEKEENELVEEAQDLPSGRGQEVLLCEDDDVVREVVFGLLTAHGYRVATFARPGALLSAIRSRECPPSLIVTDVIMPEMNGRDLVVTIRDSFPRVRALYISGYTAGVLEQQGIEGVGDFLLKKPFSAAELLERTAALIGAPGEAACCSEEGEVAPRGLGACGGTA